MLAVVSCLMHACSAEHVRGLRLQLVIGGRNKYLINGHVAQPT